MLSPRAYTFLIAAFSFYLITQIFQQYVLLFGPLESIAGLDQSIVVSQHPLNKVRHISIYASMFVMVPAYILLGLHYYKRNKVISIVAITFFLFFCFFEIGYRSIYIFQVLMVWGKEYALAIPANRILLLPRFQYFFGTVEAIYFPLLLSLMVGSLCLLICSINEKPPLLPIAMGISVLQQLSRLAAYTPFESLNIFSGVWYFVLVLITFSMLIISSIKWQKQSEVINRFKKS